MGLEIGVPAAKIHKIRKLNPFFLIATADSALNPDNCPLRLNFR
jgi:hypothetical protein